MIKIRKKHRQRLLVFFYRMQLRHIRRSIFVNATNGEINNLERCQVCFHEASI